MDLEQLRIILLMFVTTWWLWKTLPAVSPASTKGTQMQQRPSVGRIVHYQAYGSPKGEHKSLPRAAVVTEVDADGQTVGLCVLNPTGQYFNQHTRYAEQPTPGCWNWPPKV